MSDIRNLGVFATVKALWAAHPEGGQEGDYAYIGASQAAGTKYRWNKYDRIWENGDTVTQSAGRRNQIHDGDFTVNGATTLGGNARVVGNLKVEGLLESTKVKGPCRGLFPSVGELEAAYPNPEVGWWAVVGDAIPGPLYKVVNGEWAAILDAHGDPVEGGGGEIDMTYYFDPLAERLHDVEEAVETIPEIADNRTTNDSTKALSAAEGKRLGDDLAQLDNDVDGLALKVNPLSLPKNGNFVKRDGDYSAIQPYSFKDDGTYGTGTSYYHADMLVYPGEVVYVKSNETNGARVALVSNLNCPNASESYGLVTDEYYQLSAGEEKTITVPQDAVAMKVYLGQLSNGEYTQKPESVAIYRPSGLHIVPQMITMDKYVVSSGTVTHNASALGYCLPVENGKTYRLKVTNAGTSTKYSKLIATLPYRGRVVADTDLTGSSSFTTSAGVLTRTATADGMWTIFRSGSMTVSFEEVSKTEVSDPDTLATAKVLNYNAVSIQQLTHIGYYIASDTGLWKSSSSVKSVICPVMPGSLLKVIPTSSYNTILYWLASDTAPSDGGVPDCPEHHLERITISRATCPVAIFRVPEGANFVYVYTGSGDSNAPDFFGFAISSESEKTTVKESLEVMDRCAFNDKQILLNQNRGYYFDDTYTGENSYVDTSYLDRKISSVPDGKHFIFLTDSHYDYANGIGAQQKETAVVKYVRDKLGIKNVVFGGDCIGTRPNKYQAAKVMSIYTKEKFEAFGGDFIFVMGNHDTNPFEPDGGTIYDALISDEEIYARTTKFIKDYGKAVFPEKLLNIIDSSNDLVDEDGNVMTDAEKSAYKCWAMRNYYIDDDKQKIRYIVLETGDGGYTMRDIFGVTGDSQNSLMTVAYFFVDALTSVPNGYDVVVAGHWLTRSGAFWKKVFYRVLGLYKNKQSASVNFTPNTYGHPAVQPIVEKTFDNPSSLNGITIDFSHNLGSGRIFCISGHVHYDRATTKEYVSDNDEATLSVFPLSTSGEAQSLTYGANAILCIVCDRCCGIGRGSGYINGTVSQCYSYPNNGTGAGEEQRIGTTAEVLFDVVTITEDNRVVLTRFGAEGMSEGNPYTRNYVLPMAE